MGNYAGMPAALKTFDALLMLLGRLEIFGLIQLFSLMVEMTEMGFRRIHILLFLFWG